MAADSVEARVKLVDHDPCATIERMDRALASKADLEDSRADFESLRGDFRDLLAEMNAFRAVFAESKEQVRGELCAMNERRSSMEVKLAKLEARVVRFVVSTPALHIGVIYAGYRRSQLFGSS